MVSREAASLRSPATQMQMPAERDIEIELRSGFEHGIRPCDLKEPPRLSEGALLPSRS